MIYAAALPSLQAVAEGMGYALAVHGSMHNDFDLVAIPWREDAVSAEQLVDAIVDIAGYWGVDGPEKKPHNRRAWSIAMACGARIDLSVMPRGFRVDM